MTQTTKTARDLAENILDIYKRCKETFYMEGPELELASSMIERELKLAYDRGKIDERYN